ncbi:MAG: hypothetical protein K9G49_14855 [Taibaiella sp.]|nr:hypothetical protein [Taibaiella sp.]
MIRYIRFAKKDIHNFGNDWNNFRGFLKNDFLKADPSPGLLFQGPGEYHD